MGIGTLTKWIGVVVAVLSATGAVWARFVSLEEAKVVGIADRAALRAEVSTLKEDRASDRERLARIEEQARAILDALKDLKDDVRSLPRQRPSR
jgi:chromosome segregation ATPase